MTTVFGNPGSTELGLLRDFPADFRYVLALHEGVAVAMADGYAQATGRPALVNLHSACGVGNAMGAVVNAFHNRAPLVITAGNQDRRHLELEPYLFARSTALMEPYVKFSHEPARAQDVPAGDRPRLGAGAHPADGPDVRLDPDRRLGRAGAETARRDARRSRDVLAGTSATEDVLDRVAARIDAAKQSRAGGGRGRGPGGRLGRGGRARRAAERAGMDRAPGTADGLRRGPSALSGPPRPGPCHGRGAAGADAIWRSCWARRCSRSCRLRPPPPARAGCGFPRSSTSPTTRARRRAHRR